MSVAEIADVTQARVMSFSHVEVFIDQNIHTKEARVA